jgi:hypothetical protein
MSSIGPRERRRRMIQGHPLVNGIDYLEVVDGPTLPNADRQRTLLVHFLNPITEPLTAANVRIEGGDRIRNVGVVNATFTTGDSLLTVEVDRPGDFSTYTLRLVPAPGPTEPAGTPMPPNGYDPVLSQIDFSFKVACPNEFDCAPADAGASAAWPRPPIDYLARDYAGFRRLMLDRLAHLMPDWSDRSPADEQIAVVELLAYVSDYLSYRHDAIITEGYPGIARKRRSMRRHARLVDYPMHDGCNARVWVQVRVRDDIDEMSLPPNTQFLTRVPALADGPLGANSTEYAQALRSGAEVFEAVLLDDPDDGPARLHAAHNVMRLYTWGNDDCCLPAGATRATLRGPLPHLAPNTVLILGEVRGPATGNPADADLTRRHAVRLTSATPGTDPLGGFFDDPEAVDPPPLPVVEITWGPEDALPFPLQITSSAHADPGGAANDYGVAWGNIVLADHGRTIMGEPLGTPPESAQERPRFGPQLRHGPLTQTTVTTVVVERAATPLSAVRQTRRVRPYDPAASAAATLHTDPRGTRPALTVRDADGDMWEPRRDLLTSRPDDRQFVAEVEAEGVATLRFGDDVNGRAATSRPWTDAEVDAAPPWTATYRIGNGTHGNVGARSIAYIVSADDGIVGATNPLPASGGIDAETIEEVRQRAPVAFRSQERAVTADDYARMAERYPGVQRAAATFRWTGSWRTVFVTVDRLGGLEVDAAFELGLRRHLDRYRMAAVDIEVDGPRFVPLEIELRVCVAAGHRADRVTAGLLEALSSGYLPGGRRALFHPDNLTFGQTLYLSAIYASAQAVPSVASVEITTFQRQGIPGRAALAAGKLTLHRLEIAQLDNDPNHSERGILRIVVAGEAGMDVGAIGPAYGGAR